MEVVSMKVLLIEPQTPPVVRETDGSLESLQRLVGGYIEPVYLPDLGLESSPLLLVNEEGILQGLPRCRTLIGSVGILPLFGPIVAVGSDDEDFCSLSDYDAEFLSVLFGAYPPPFPGWSRQWLRCRKCGRLQYLDYLPHSLSNPILTSVCGHDVRSEMSQLPISVLA